MDVDGTDLPFQDNSVDIGRLTEQIYRLRIIQLTQVVKLAMDGTNLPFHDNSVDIGR